MSLPPVGGLEHPHLICDMADIEALRGRIGAGRPRALWNRLTANCEFYQDLSNPFCIDVEARGDDLAAGGDGFHAILRAVAELGFADLIAGERRRGQLAARVLSTVLRPDVAETTWILAPRDKRSGPPDGGEACRDIPRANVDMQLAMAYDLTAPFMDDGQKRVVQDFLLDRLQHAWDHRWRAPLGTNNRPVRFQMDPAAEAMSLWGDRDEPVLTRWPAYAEPIAEDYLEEAFYSDGASVEGMHYGGCISYVLNFAHMLDRKGIRHGLLDPRPVFKNLVLFYYLSRDPGDVAFSMAKCTPMPLVGFHMWLQIARFFDVPLARWWWRRRFDALCENPEMAGFEALREQRVNLPMTMLFCDDAEPDASPEQLNLPASHRFWKRGLVVARRDHDDRTPVFRLIAGPHSNTGTVQHWDAFSISLSAFGQRLIVDPGKGGTTANWFNGITSSHSSVLVNGKGQEALCSSRGEPALLDAETEVGVAATSLSIRRRPGLIRWHEREGELEYTMASTADCRCGVVADGYGGCKAAERHALVVHDGRTPFYVVLCDMFDYSEEMSWREPALEFVLIAADDTTVRADEQVATIEGPKASLRAELVTRDRATVRQDRLAGAGNPRLIWSRKGACGRILSVLTPIQDGIRPPEVELLADSERQTACVVRFGECEDRIVFWARRDNIETDRPGRLKTGMRVKVVRGAAGKAETVFTIPTLAGSYVIE